MSEPRWWQPEHHAARRPRLLARMRIVAALRRFFDGHGFLEVDPATLQVSPGNETHLHAFRVERDDGGPAYLHTSPEFAMKKLLAAGEERLVAFAHVFRDREVSPLHHPEFTMLEWYRAREPYRTLMADCAAILALAADAAGSSVWRYRGRSADPRAVPEQLTVVEAFARHADMNLLPLLPEAGESLAAGQGATVRFGAAARAAGIRTVPDDSWPDLFSRVLSERIEPRLGLGTPTVLLDYPASEAALARQKPSNPRFAERFELYICGVELANAFGELTNPVEQRSRFMADMDEKMRIYGERYPLDEDFLAALALMPPASGAALGLDRLVMLAVGAERVADVIWTPLADAASP
ncbi:EF-P lysine aminoacylase EpmA [Chelatococcus reniformis]|uniref:Elongation factor P--(R)-beta-lysine ligase n=1 Tax=Chelatococcus reniformis TaxID=1494448 RepID=A0A916X9A8_9HYPH|nr:EF-P lysine aminoacylase EpmA [Chelatococcus reniformis]GGC54245.1 elongation factor P--(R)-beta-lysine ligase [Chelatococcus reniformis]